MKYIFFFGFILISWFVYCFTKVSILSPLPLRLSPLLPKNKGISNIT